MEYGKDLSMAEKERTYFCIDMKSFYASVDTIDIKVKQAKNPLI